MYIDKSIKFSLKFYFCAFPKFFVLFELNWVKSDTRISCALMYTRKFYPITKVSLHFLSRRVNKVTILKESL